jgi:hypothetical protein
MSGAAAGAPPADRLRRPSPSSRRCGISAPAGVVRLAADRRANGRALREPGLIGRMQFDRHTLVLLVRRPDAPELRRLPRSGRPW